MLVVPPAARCAAWLNAWLTGRAAADDAIDHLSPPLAAAAFAMAPGEAALSPALLLGELRARGVSRAGAALPVPGDPIGLAGPTAFNAAALEARGAVILDGAAVGLVPHVTGSGVLWQAVPAERPPWVADVATAARELRGALLEATERLVDLDVASWSPDVADAVMNLRVEVPFDAPMSFAAPSDARLCLDGLRAAEIVRLGLLDNGGAVTAAEMDQRRAALVPLRRAAHVAVIAACSVA